MEKLDRRIRKTRAQLIGGLITLLKEKDIQDISVKELADLVDINRGTFYLHYNDIYDMVHKIEDELFAEFETILEKDFPTLEHPVSPYEAMLDVFHVLENKKEITRVLIGPHGDLIFVNRMKNMVKQRIETLLETTSTNPNNEFYSAFVVSGFIGIFETWLLKDDPATPEHMAEFCANILTPFFRNIT